LTVANPAQGQGRTPVRTEIFNSRHGIFQPSKKDHGLIANFSAHRFVSDFVSTTGNVPFIFKKHLISLKAAWPDAKQFFHKAAFSQRSRNCADVSHL
jgi:hypothetical protein